MMHIVDVEICIVPEEVQRMVDVIDRKAVAVDEVSKNLSEVRNI